MYVWKFKIITITYDSEKEVVYPGEKIDDNVTLVVKWINTDKTKDNMTLEAQALMILKSKDKYELYSDNKFMNMIGSFDSLSEAKKAALESYYLSYNYKFTIAKEDGNYIWRTFERTSNNQVVS